MSKVVFTTTLYVYDTTMQVVDLSCPSTIILSRKHPRRGTSVNTTLFMEALRAYTEQMTDIRRLCKSATTRTNYVDVDHILDIYRELEAYQTEQILSVIFG